MNGSRRWKDDGDLDILDEARSEWQNIVDPDESDSPADEPAKLAPRTPRGRGGPKWSAEEFEAHWCEAWDATPPPRTYSMLAANFRQLNGAEGTDPRHLRYLRKTKFPRTEPE